MSVLGARNCYPESAPHTRQSAVVGAERGGLGRPVHPIVGVCMVPGSLQRGSSPPFLVSAVLWDHREGSHVLQFKTRRNKEVKYFTQGHVAGRLAPAMCPLSQQLLFLLGALSGVLVAPAVAQVLVWASQDLSDSGPWSTKSRWELPQRCQHWKSLSPFQKPLVEHRCWITHLSAFGVYLPAQPVP